MRATDTTRALRLHTKMAPPRRRRHVRAALAAAAAVAVIGGAVGVGLALRSGGKTTAPPVNKPTPTTLAAGTLPSGFPIGTYKHPGSGGLTTLRITRHAVAAVTSPQGVAFNDLTFTTPDVVTFDTHNGAGCTTPGRYRWAISSDRLVLTTIEDSCVDRRIALTEISWGHCATAPTEGGADDASSDAKAGDRGNLTGRQVRSRAWAFWTEKSLLSPAPGVASAAR
jgi:hypothetical protein